MHSFLFASPCMASCGLILLWRHQGRRLKWCESHMSWAICWCLPSHVGSRRNYFWDLLSCLTFEVVASCWWQPPAGCFGEVSCPLWHQHWVRIARFLGEILRSSLMSSHMAPPNHHTGNHITVFRMLNILMDQHILHIWKSRVWMT